MRDYKLIEGITRKELVSKGNFSSNYILNKYVYKKFILLRLRIESDKENELVFYYDIWDCNNKCRYTPFYYDEYGKNLVLHEVKKNVKREMKRLMRLGILEALV